MAFVQELNFLFLNFILIKLIPNIIYNIECVDYRSLNNFYFGDGAFEKYLGEINQFQGPK